MIEITLTDGTKALYYLEQSPTGLIQVLLVPDPLNPNQYRSARHSFTDKAMAISDLNITDIAKADALAARAKKVSGADVGLDETALVA